MKYLCVILLFVMIGFQSNSQNKKEYIEGRVSFISSQNVYAKFISTEGIQIGDSLFKQSENGYIPVLKVKSISSISCVGDRISEDQMAVSDQIFAYVPIQEKQEVKPVITKVDTIIKVVEEPIKEEVKKEETKNERGKFYGKVSASTYSTFSKETSLDFQRMRYTLSLNYKDIGGSKFSVESYMNFNHKVKEWNEIQDNVFNGLKIYNLNLKYELNESSHLLIGRKINHELSNVGAIDGLQAEKEFKSINLGGFIGSRPKYEDYSFDFNLLQYGAYVAWKMEPSTGKIRNTIAFIEQMNNKAVDRRFLYYQHYTSLKKLYVFVSLEAELYKTVNDQPTNVFEFSSFYLYSRYRFTNKLSLSATYDARKNVIYYETFKNQIDSILDAEIRQGYSMRFNYRPNSKISMGLRTGYRFKKSDPTPSINVNGYLSFYHLPIWEINATVDATYLQTSYLNAGIYGLRMHKGFLNEKLYAGVSYRFLNGLYNYTETKLNQNIIELSLDWKVYKKLYFSIDYETTLSNASNDSRVYLNLSKRF